MAKSYFKEFMKTETYYYAWPGGWECPFREGKIIFYRGVPAKSKVSAREDLRIDKLIARASENADEFRKLRRRCDSYITEKIKELDLKGDALRNYILTTPTDQEVRNQAIYDYGYSR